MEEVMVERLMCGLMEAKMKTIRRMVIIVVVRIKGEIIPTILVIKIMEIKEEEEEEEDWEEEDFVEHISNVMKKGIEPMSVSNIKGG